MSAALSFRFTNIFKIFSSYLYWCLILGFFVCSATSLKAAELMVNGSFEMGNFTGWTIANASNSFINWNVSGPGSGGGFIPVPVVTSPVDGTRVAWQGIACNAGSSYVWVLLLLWFCEGSANHSSTTLENCNNTKIHIIE